MKVLDRFGAFAGSVYVVLVVVGNALSTGPTSQASHPSGPGVIANNRWLAGSISGQTGVCLELSSFAAWIVFTGYLCTRLRPAGWLATSALIGGAVSVAVKLGSAAPLLAAYVLRNDVSPDTARALNDMNGLAFVVDWLPVGVFVACAAAAAAQLGAVGRVLGWGGVLVGTVSAVATAVTGVHVLGGNPVPFLLCLLWILLVSVRLGVQRRPQSAETSEPAPVQVEV